MDSDFDSNPEYVADQLQRLMDMPLETQDDLQGWLAEADGFREALNRLPDSNVPHEVWHYLDDADIRHRDEAYREAQHSRVRDLIAKLRGKRTI